jgi:hypothetical protein
VIAPPTKEKGADRADGLMLLPKTPIPLIFIVLPSFTDHDD